MPYTWTTEMGDVSSNPDLETDTRAAIIAACEFNDALDEEDEIPRFNGTTHVNPVNQAALDMEAHCLTGVTATGINRAAILSAAVNASELHRSSGGGEDGWAALAAELPRSRRLIEQGPLS